MTDFQLWLVGEWTVHEFCLERGPFPADQVRKLDALKRDLKESLAPDMDRVDNEKAGRMFRQTFFARAPEVIP